MKDNFLFKSCQLKRNLFLKLSLFSKAVNFFELLTAIIEKKQLMRSDEHNLPEKDLQKAALFFFFLVSLSW